MSTNGTMTNAQRELRPSLVRTLRRMFSEATGLRTFAANQWTNGGTFDAEAPYDQDSESGLLDFMTVLEQRGFTVDFRIRASRMTIEVS